KNFVDLTSDQSIAGTKIFTGNVGIGTNDSKQKLSVAGDASFSGSVYISGSKNYLRFDQQAGNGDDGKIGNSLWYPGLNIVGINSDKTFRKIQLWGQITQNENSGTNTWGGINYFHGN